MSFRPMFQQVDFLALPVIARKYLTIVTDSIQRAVAPIAATLLTGGLVFYPRQTAFAEEPNARKPIYDDFPTDIPEPTKTLPAPPKSSPFSSSSPTLTDILTAQVRQVRLFLYENSLAVENSFNNYLSRALHIENAFTNTIASLAPSPESGERLLPGGAYVVVSAMAGSIVSRNRGVFFRTASPLTFGTVAAWTLLPVTMRNISDLVWEYEKKIPAVAKQHLYIRERAEQIWSTSVAHSAMTRAMMEEKIGETRKKLEELVSKGH
ncbi:apolipo protein O-domain-containing protein [Aspergillus coremiiformis]|uniref:MICOS complex subunit n=1 Tax=Aspergillus coremiiformis TaxID=138285 RepID=A0A5N6ZFU4_9EURO|nr:apolipo protein O-domain-containing protein [Aspergillus coremiiformis]